MTEIYQLTLTKKSLAAMPPAERRLLLLLGHATNEISVLQKLILVSGQFGTPHKFVDHVQSGQTLILMRVLIGKLYEAWELFKTRFQADQQIRTRYQPKFNAEALAALADLNKHFSTHSPLRLIRNRFSFHYKDEGDLVEQSFQQIPDAEAWEFYLSNMYGNCFFYASELVVGGGIISLADNSRDPAEPYLDAQLRSFGALCDLTISVSSRIQCLFGQCITEIVSQSLPDAAISSSIVLDDLPVLSALQIPFFVDDTEFSSMADVGDLGVRRRDHDRNTR